MICLLVLAVSLLPSVMSENGHPYTTPSYRYCTDSKGERVRPGDVYYPKAEDPCFECTCDDTGNAVMCKTVKCGPPPVCTTLQTVEGMCCEFHCVKTSLDDIVTSNKTEIIPSPGFMENSDFGLRLVASTVTSLLILALLLFMMHRLRQRRLLIMMRRLNTEPPEEDAMNYMTQLDHVDIEIPPYEGPPPPYSSPKLSDIPDGEPPPPYEEFEGQGQSNSNDGDEGQGRRGRNVQVESCVDDRVATSPDVIPREGGGGHEGACCVDVDVENRPSCSDPRNGDSYGLSVAVMSGTRPSQVVVRMQSNTPRMALLRSLDKTSKDKTASPTGEMPEGLQCERRPFNDRRRFVGSPKNCSGHFGESESSETDYNANPTFTTFSLPSSSYSPRKTQTQNASKSLKKNNRASKPFRIKDFASTCQKNDPQGERRPMSMICDHPRASGSQRHSAPLHHNAALQKELSKTLSKIDATNAAQSQSSAAGETASPVDSDRVDRVANASTPVGPWLLSPVQTPIKNQEDTVACIPTVEMRNTEDGDLYASTASGLAADKDLATGFTHSVGGDMENSETTYSVCDRNQEEKSSSHSGNAGYMPMTVLSDTAPVQVRAQSPALAKPTKNDTLPKNGPRIIYCDVEDLSSADSATNSSTSLRSCHKEEEDLCDRAAVGHDRVTQFTSVENTPTPSYKNVTNSEKPPCGKQNRSPATSKEKRKKRRSQPELPDVQAATEMTVHGNSLPRTSQFKQYGFIDGPETLAAVQGNGRPASMVNVSPNFVERRQRMNKKHERRPGSKDRPSSGRQSRENSGDRSKSSSHSRLRNNVKSSPDNQRHKRQSHVSSLPPENNRVTRMTRSCIETALNDIESYSTNQYSNRISQTDGVNIDNKLTQKLDNTSVPKECCHTSQNLDNIEFLTSEFSSGAQQTANDLNEISSGKSSTVCNGLTDIR